MRLTLTEIKKRISKLIPSDIDYEVDLEAGSISIITKNLLYLSEVEIV